MLRQKTQTMTAVNIVKQACKTINHKQTTQNNACFTMPRLPSERISCVTSAASCDEALAKGERLPAGLWAAPFNDSSQVSMIHSMISCFDICFSSVTEVQKVCSDAVHIVWMSGPGNLEAHREFVQSLQRGETSRQKAGGSPGWLFLFGDDMWWPSKRYGWCGWDVDEMWMGCGWYVDNDTRLFYWCGCWCHVEDDHHGDDSAEGYSWR